MDSKIFFKNSKGNKLCGIVNNPSKSKVKPIIVLAHGFSSNKNSGTYTVLTERLAKYNISTLRFDFYGHGESEGRFEDITISEAVDDILQAIKYLKLQGYKKIGLMGSSFGGISSIIAASSRYLYMTHEPFADVPISSSTVMVAGSRWGELTSGATL